MIRKNLQQLSRQFRQQQQIYKFSSQAQEEVKINPPELSAIELEPFKFQQERNQLMYGYTMEELYGKKYGIKHSEKLKYEMTKDNILMLVLLFGGIAFGLSSRELKFQLRKDFDNYINHDRNTVRPIPDHVKDE